MNDAETAGPSLFRVPAVSEDLGLGESTVYEFITPGVLRTVHIGRAVRVPRAAIAEFIE